MRTHAKRMPQRLHDLRNGQYHLNHSLEIIPVENEEPDYFYESCLVKGEPTYSLLVASVIAHRYSTANEIALINNFNADKDVQDYVDYQHYREVAKHIAGTADLLSLEQVEQFSASLKKIKITLPIGKVVDGGPYAGLADLLMKKKAIFASSDTHVTVWVSYLLPDHEQILAADPEILIEH